MTAYYNEIDRYCAAWLRNLIAEGLIAPGDVDERDICDVRPDDLRGYTQCHFFAGIGVWSYALRLADWPDDRPVWTGSCPCQGLSSATRGRPTQRDLWPEWRRLIVAERPRAVFGEQVAERRLWVDRLCDDVEAVAYAVGAAVLPAFSVGADHARYRIFFVCDPNSEGQPVCAEYGEVARVPRATGVAEPVAGADDHTARVGRLRAYGNAIVAEVAAEFVRAYLDRGAVDSAPQSLLDIMEGAADA